MKTELLVLSIDSINSHIAWVRNIEEKFGTKIEFPVIADLSMEGAVKFGMIMPNESSTEASRAVFVIDDKQIVRAIIYYSLSTGRNMDEMVRALQTADEHNVTTPADWQEGDKVYCTFQEDAEERMNNKDYECVDFYFCKRDL